MKRISVILLALGMMMIISLPNLQALTIDCYPVSDVCNTGTVSSGFVITDSSEIWEVGGDGYRGWSKFDISGIPDGSTIYSVTMYLYFNSIDYPWFYWYRLDNDPLTLIGNPSALYTDCGDGAEYLYYAGDPLLVGWYSHSLGGTAVADLEGALTVDWFGVGHKTDDASTTYYYHADGWNEANPPYLTVEYTPAVPYGVEIIPEVSDRTGLENSDVDHAFSIRNFGNNNDTYDLAISGHTWSTEIYDATGTSVITTLAVTAGNTEDCIVRVSIPAGAGIGERDSTYLSATSQWSPTVADTSKAITEVSSTANIDCYPTAAWYNTGTVNNSAVITDSSEIWEVGGDGYRGWSKFNVSGIPDGATINSVTMYLYFNSIYWPWFYWYRLDNDPLTLIGNPSALYTDCGDGAEYLCYDGDLCSVGWYSHSLGGTAVTDLENALTDDWFGVGHKTDDVDPDYYYHADGWNEANPPYLTVNYTPPVPYGVEVTPETSTGMGTENSNVDHTFSVYNYGLNNDVYNLAVFGNTWTTGIYDSLGTTPITTLSVASRSIAECIVRVSIPVGASPGARDTTSFSAISQGDPTVGDSSTAITIVLSGLLGNGDFETGDLTSWDEYGPSCHYKEVIQRHGSWVLHVHIGSGCGNGWSTVLSPQCEVVYQRLVLPANADSITFWEECSGLAWHDGGYIWIEDHVVPDTTRIFSRGGGGGSSTYYPWAYCSVDISAWAGRDVTIYLGSVNGNGYGDHVADIYFDDIDIHTTAVPSITDLVIQISGADVILSWSAMTGALSYNIYRDDDPSFIPSPVTLVGTTSVTQWTDTGIIAANTKSFYVVTVEY